MEKKNIIILILGTSLFFSFAFFYYNMEKQKEMYLKTMKNLQYNMSKGNGKSKNKDPYKEVAVNNSLRKKARHIQKCYNTFVATKPRKTDGFVEIDWIILTDGGVKKAELIASDLGNESLSLCILNTIKSIEFPPPPTASETYMTYKYNFKKANEKK